MSTSNKYEPGEFGYWWTVTKKFDDIEGIDYEGNINATAQELTSLRGSPRSVTGNFWCHANHLTSLENCPKEVGRFFYCDDNQLTSLTYAPHKVGKSFECENNPIKDIMSELITNDIVAEEYVIAEGEAMSFSSFAAEKTRRANIKRQLGPFAITVPRSKV